MGKTASASFGESKLAHRIEESLMVMLSRLSSVSKKSLCGANRGKRC